VTKLERVDGRQYCVEEIIPKVPRGYRKPKPRECSNLALPGSMYCGIHKKKHDEEEFAADISNYPIEKEYYSFYAGPTLFRTTVFYGGTINLGVKRISQIWVTLSEDDLDNLITLLQDTKDTLNKLKAVTKHTL